MKKTALIIMVLTVLSKIFGFGREVTLSYLFGASNISDAYLISTTIPNVIFSFLSVGLVAGYIPMYSKIHENENKKNADLFTSNIINILFVLCTFIILLSVIFAKPIVKLFASGFSAETLTISIEFTRISIFSIYFLGLAAIYSGYLQIKNNHIVPSLIGLPLNIIVILSIIIGYHFGLIFLAVGFVIATATKAVIMIPSMSKFNYRHKLICNFRDQNIIKMTYIIIPIIIGTSVNQVNTLVDRTLASRIIEGGISALNYANILNSFIQGVFVISIVTVFYPLISKMAVSQNIIGIKSVTSKVINAVNILLIPITIGTIIFTSEIVSIIYGRGAFNQNAVDMTSSALLFYSIGMIGFGLREVLSRVFYAMQNTKIPMVNAAIGMGINIILNIILSHFLGLGGLALATSIAATFTTILLFISLRKKIGPFGMKQISISFLKILFASLVMGGLAKLSFNYLTSSLSQNLSLLIAIGVGALSYFVIIYFMKIEDVDMIVGAIKKKLGRGAAK